jgi:hypothetical protein
MNNATLAFDNWRALRNGITDRDKSLTWTTSGEVDWKHKAFRVVDKDTRLCG